MGALPVMFGGRPGPAWRCCDHCKVWDGEQRHVWFGPYGQVSMHQICCAERGCPVCREELGVHIDVAPTEADMGWLYAHQGRDDPVRYLTEEDRAFLRAHGRNEDLGATS